MAPVVLVCGLGRCGTSLTMQMLHAGGLPCIGHWPAFEEHRANFESFDADFIASHPGHAVKILDPQRVRLQQGQVLSRLPAIVIWLLRDFTEQAKSQAKLLESFVGMTSNRLHRRRLVASLRRDTALAHDALDGLPMRTVPFERLVYDPADGAATIDSFLREHGLRIDQQKAAAAVIDRPTSCLPDMLEVELLRRMPADVA